MLVNALGGRPASRPGSHQAETHWQGPLKISKPLTSFSIANAFECIYHIPTLPNVRSPGLHTKKPIATGGLQIGNTTLAYILYTYKATKKGAACVRAEHEIWVANTICVHC
jgi:hypothetical protein